MICKQQVHQDAKYCHTCAYSKGKSPALLVIYEPLRFILFVSRVELLIRWISIIIEVAGTNLGIGSRVLMDELLDFVALIFLLKLGNAIPLINVVSNVVLSYSSLHYWKMTKI